MEEKLVLKFVLESHYNMVPNGSESVFTGAHSVDDYSVYVSIKVPAFNIRYITSLDRYREADGNDLPSQIVHRVCQISGLVQGWKNSLMMDNIQI